MNLSGMAEFLWAAGFILNAALLFVLLYKQRFRAVPWFTAWIGFHCLYTITLFWTYRDGSKHLYFLIYWAGAFLDLLLQIGIVLEIARSVLQRSGRWIEGARAGLVSVAAIAPLVGILMAWFMVPAAETKLDAWAARGSLFTTILICLLFTAVVVISQQLGLGWGSHIMRESYGLVLWTLVSFATDTLHAYWRTMGVFTALEDIRIVFFQASLIYWAVAFWRPEPSPKVMTPAAIKRLTELTSRLDYSQTQRQPAKGGGLQE